MKETGRRFERTPFDMRFETSDGEKIFHVTGWEVCFGDTWNPAHWFMEYIDADGKVYYGRLKL